MLIEIELTEPCWFIDAKGRHVSRGDTALIELIEIGKEEIK